MLLPLTRSAPDEVSPPLPLARWGGLVALLLAELLFLSFRFDAGSLDRHHQWWADLIRQARYLPQFGVVLAVALLVFGGPRLAEALRRLTARHRRRYQPWMFLAGHLITLAGFVYLTQQILEGDLRNAPAAGRWVLTWLALAVVSLGFWAGAVLPPALWLSLARQGLGLLLLGLVVGVVALEAGWLTLRLWEPLGQATVWVVYRLLLLAYGQALWLPDPDEPDNFYVGALTGELPLVKIAPHCSGYEGIGLIWVYLVFVLWYYRREVRFPQALLLFPLGTAVIWLANALRITALIMIGTHAPKVALAGFHSQAGWLAFNAVALGLLYLLRSWRWVARPAETSETDAGGSRLVAAYVAPLFVTLAAMSVGLAFSAGLDRLYPVRVLAAAVTLAYFWRSYPDLRWRRGWLALAVGAAVFGLWLLLGPVPTEDSARSPWQALAGWPDGYAAVWLAFRILGAAVIFPLVEELAFRGFLTRWLIAFDIRTVPPGQFTWFSFLGSSVAFGFLHSSWLAGTLAGMLYALALYRRGRVADAVWAHATTNLLVTAYVLATGHWAQWT